jgi:IS30 family transposase
MGVAMTKGVPLTREVRRAFWDEIRDGRWPGDAALAVGVSAHMGHRWMAEAGGVMEPRVEPTGLRLSHEERDEIAALGAAGLSDRQIATRLGRHHSTISREVARNRNREGDYRALTAHRRAQGRARRPKQARLAQCGPLRDYVQDKLSRVQWSPAQISNVLRVDFPDNPSMQVSHETIYQALYVQSRGALRRELTTHLRTQRQQRQPQRRPDHRKGRLVDTISISERPAEAADRAVPGHWEGDLILGKAGGSAIGTLVERSSRFVMLVHLPARRTALDFRDALVPVLASFPEQLRRSLTWDQGKEMALHKQIAMAADIDIYFCDPRSPWQRGSNENTNGLLRQYFPKNVSLRQFTPNDLTEVAHKLNTRPRKTLGWTTPAQRLNELLCEQGPTNGVAMTG